MYLFNHTGGFIPETDYLTVEPDVFTTDLVTVVDDVTIYVKYDSIPSIFLKLLILFLHSLIFLEFHYNHD